MPFWFLFLILLIFSAICFIFAILLMEEPDAPIVPPQELPPKQGRTNNSPIVTSKSKPKDLNKPPSVPKVKIDSKKLKDFSDILRAIGFSTKEAKEKVTELLTEKPDATEIELLRKATDK